MILRRHLRQRLAEYYAQPADRVVGGLGSGSRSAPRIDFSSLLNRWHWKRKYRECSHRAAFWKKR